MSDGNKTVEYVEYDGDKAFRVTWETWGDGTGWDATVDEVTSWEDDGEPADFQAHIRWVRIKWDSCSHLNFGADGDKGYLHFCGVTHFRRHAALMETLYRMAFRAMGREPEDGEVWS